MANLKNLMEKIRKNYEEQLNYLSMVYDLSDEDCIEFIDEYNKLTDWLYSDERFAKFLRRFLDLRLDNEDAEQVFEEYEGNFNALVDRETDAYYERSLSNNA